MPIIFFRKFNQYSRLTLLFNKKSDFQFLDGKKNKILF